MFQSSKPQLPLKQIPGSYGLPFFGPIRDRHDYFYHQGRDNFFATRIKQHNSTVIKINMPPGPFISSNSKVIALLDGASFPILFYNTKVEKRNVLDGTFMPSTPFTGGHRVCAYLDTTEPNQLYSNASLSKISFLGKMVRRTSTLSWVPPRLTSCSGFFVIIKIHQRQTLVLRVLDYLIRGFYFSLFRLQRLVFLRSSTILIRTVPFPFCFATSRYKKLYEAFLKEAKTVLDEVEKLGIKRSEACHNLVFMAGFNAYGGLKNQFPILMKWIGLAGESLHKELAEEIRTVVKEEGGAREDLVVQSHDASFEIKKGDMIFGYQPFATKDPRIFEDPEEFVARRFVGEGEKKLLKHVLWSNGSETEEPSPENKQCPGKNLVVLLCRLFLVEFFLRYDTFEFEYKTGVLGAAITIKSFTKASTF
ncbi:hypothetical protein TanjilG_00583 [Lupinus angustifolius]|uniref:Allene oxide synthase n=1 Tax=Lupinus angustifolius TaxID=3871 RepID=A0A394D9D8_LUPAN|nr:hypothetical protein TanjilG_00583 [Lupinus angustifolius]